MQNSPLLRLHLVFVASLIGFVTLLAGCQSAPKSDPETAAQGKEVFRPSKSQTGSESDHASSSPADGKWTIAVLRLKGTEQDAAAQTVLRTVRASGLPEAYLETRSDATLVAVGRFDSPTTPDAKAMLKRVKEMDVDGARPYMGAYFMPPPATSLKGSVPEWDLRNARANYGKQAEYTLQINIYTNPRGQATPAEVKEFQAAAEEAVRTLRKDGVDAFYFHDQAGSTVTVGLFSQKDLDGAQSLSPGARTSPLSELQRKFPNGMVNGAGVKERSVDAQGRPVEVMRPSFIVRVPS
ncbi:MAG: hypothetical protein U0573_04190 [Phycisphaerales bacterium]|nr:hypothetical protein [Planctomycetota bacterium]